MESGSHFWSPRELENQGTREPGNQGSREAGNQGSREMFGFSKDFCNFEGKNFFQPEIFFSKKKIQPNVFPRKKFFPKKNNFSPQCPRMPTFLVIFGPTFGVMSCLVFDFAKRSSMMSQAGEGRTHIIPAFVVI